MDNRGNVKRNLITRFYWKVRDRVKSRGMERMEGGFTVARLHVKVAKVVSLVPILQIVQIYKSTSYVESVG
jgi:hypothetical protein